MHVVLMVLVKDRYRRTCVQRGQLMTLYPLGCLHRTCNASVSDVYEGARTAGKD